jgi:hypothetical protein
MSGFFGTVSGFFQAMDLYGHEFRLNHRGTEKKITYCGAFFTVFVACLASYITAKNFVKLVTRGEKISFTT